MSNCLFDDDDSIVDDSDLKSLKSLTSFPQNNGYMMDLYMVGM